MADQNAASPPGAARILLVDDDQSLLRVTNRILVKLGYSVDAFSDPEKALEAFRLAPMTWDVVVTDRAMPRLTGEELCTEIMKIRKGMPIVMATGFGERPDEENARNIGVSEFLYKPLESPEIAVAVRRALATDESRAHNA
jgi:DNA-binding NtrC family response regulator